MNATILSIIAWLADLLVGSGTFDRVKAAVARWQEKQISGVEKREGVLDELQIIGIEASASVMNLMIELAVQLLKLQDKE
jgi:hypothetical protein